MVYEELGHAPERTEPTKRIHHITLKIELDLDQLGYDEDEAQALATSYIDDYLNELFRKDNNIADWDIEAEINHNY